MTRTVNIAVTPRLKAARQSYAACPRPRPVHRPMAQWPAPARPANWLLWSAIVFAFLVGVVATNADIIGRLPSAPRHSAEPEPVPVSALTGEYRLAQGQSK